jgi:predicted Zn-dependent protease
MYTAAGYDPNAFVSFFKKVEAEEKRRPGTVPKFFSTHPPTPARVPPFKKKSAKSYQHAISTPHGGEADHKPAKTADSSETHPTIRIGLG